MNLGQRLKDVAPRRVKDVADATTRRYALVTAPWRPPPDFLVIGTKRGGTTSLFNYLLMHPGIHGLVPSVRGKKSTDYFFKEWERGERWYRSHFPATPLTALRERRLGYRPVAGEASPYYVWDPRIAQRVHDVAPRVKAVLLLRDPTERAWSHYLERRQMGVEPLSFEQALDAEAKRTGGELERMMDDPAYTSDAFDWYSYRARGVYRPQIENWRRTFPADHLLVLRSEDLYARTQDTFDQVCDFLSIRRHALLSLKTFNASKGRTTIPAQAEADLRDYFRPHNADLKAYLGRPLGWD